VWGRNRKRKTVGIGFYSVAKIITEARGKGSISLFLFVFELVDGLILRLHFLRALVNQRADLKMTVG
jgi:hypothetical protein